MPTKRRPVTRVLIAFVLAAVVAHICALPGTVDAVTSSADHGDAHPHSASDHEEPGDGHAATCAALRPGTTTTVVATPAMLAPIAPDGAAGSARSPRSADVAPGAASSPLYLTHRALLI